MRRIAVDVGRAKPEEPPPEPPNVAIPINAAVAADVLSDNAVADVDAAQQTPIDQS